MTFQARPIQQDHLSALFKLTVKDEQQDQVAPNVFTLAEAAYEPGSAVWGLWDDDTPIGLIAMINPTKSTDEDVLPNPTAAYIWRLLIAAEHQGKGYGDQAIAHARAVAKDWGMTHMTLSFVDKPGGAEKFYTKHGFTRTGRVFDDELEMSAPV